MTREQHMAAYREHTVYAMDALNYLKKYGHDDAIWKAYKAENREANKHYGIAQAMMTRETNRIAGYKVV